MKPESKRWVDSRAAGFTKQRFDDFPCSWVPALEGQPSLVRPFNEKGHREDLGRQNIRAPVRPLDEGYGLLVEVLLEARGQDLFQPRKPIEIHVVKDMPSFVLIYEGKRGAGNHRLFRYPEAESHSFGKPRLTAPQRARDGQHIARMKKGTKPPPQLNGFLG